LARPSVEELQIRLSEGALAADPFGVVRDVAHAYALAEAGADSPADSNLLRARELIIRMTEERDQLGDALPMHDSLLARIGLYPYLREGELSGSDLLAYEAHRPVDDFGGGMVWHRDQARAYAHLLDGRSVILSAPTSFGKSRIIDGLVASGKFASMVIVVPTIALIDESRRRLSRLAGDNYKVVTHVGQASAEKTIYVLTQERVLEFEELPEVDLFVIDEFYKLSLDGGDPDRSRLLNLAFYALLQTGAQFYMLGPNIGGIGAETLERLECVWIDSWDTTVAVDIETVARGGAKKKRLLDLCGECRERGEQTLIYCSSPEKAEGIGIALAEAELGKDDARNREAAKWLGEHYDPRWRVARALAKGIGVHHGQLPRALGHYMVSAFDHREIDFLVCTPTLIEGVNTKAKNVIAFDQTIGQRNPLDLFTFNNIRGRSGRMATHYTGRVYVFKPVPAPPLQEIDIPVLSQPEGGPPELLLGLPDEEIGHGGRQRLDDLLAETPVPAAVLEATPGVSIEHQLKLAGAIERLSDERAAALSWSSAYPGGEQISAVFDLVWQEILEGRRDRPFGAGSVAQLLVWISLLEQGDTRQLIAKQIEFYGDDKLDRTILAVLKFQRRGLTFEAPKWLTVVDRLQRVLLPRRGLDSGDYSAFLARIESLFLPAPLAALDEYGVPIELARKLSLRLGGDELDAVLARLDSLDLDAIDLDPFERRLLHEAQADLGFTVA